MTYYIVQSKNESLTIITIGHSKDEETKEIYYKFADNKKANKLLEDEKAINPKLKYRIVKVIERIEVGSWK